MIYQLTHNIIRHVSWAIVFILFFAFIFSLVYQARREKANRLRVEKLLSELEISHRQLQEYAAKAVRSAAMEERNRLARDIHDSLGHYLTVINIQLEKAIVFEDRNPKTAAQAVRNAKRLAGEALQDIRRSVGVLRNNSEPFSLVEAIRGLINNLQGGRFSIEFDTAGEEDGFSRHTLLTLYRAAQESLTNIEKHAQATSCRISLEFQGQQASLRITDNGRGFEPHIQEQEELHYGLRGVRERLEVIQGSLEISSSPGIGASLLITAPKNKINHSRIGGPQDEPAI